MEDKDIRLKRFRDLNDEYGAKGIMSMAGKDELIKEY